MSETHQKPPADPATPKYNHKPYVMTRHEVRDNFTGPGNFMWRFDEQNRRILVLAIPSLGRRGWSVSEWTIDHKNASDAQWKWDGNEDKPTLTPSLHAMGVWHGHVKAGELVEA